MKIFLFSIFLSINSWGNSCESLFNAKTLGLQINPAFSRFFNNSNNLRINTPPKQENTDLIRPNSKDRVVIITLSDLVNETSILSLNEIISLTQNLRRKHNTLKSKGIEFINFTARQKALFPDADKSQTFRTLNESELEFILRSGFLEQGRYFTFFGSRPLIGFNENFIYVSCNNCPQSFFQGGSTGAGIVNKEKIPLKHLNVWIPILRD